MATQSPHRDVGGSAPASSDVSPTVDGHGSDKGRHTSPWPLADTPGRPFIHQLKHDESVRDWAYSAAIWTSVILMGLAIFATLADAYFDRTFQ